MTPPDFTIQTERPIRQAFEAMCAKASWIAINPQTEHVEIKGWRDREEGREACLQTVSEPVS